MKDKIQFSPVGIIHTPFDGKEKIPHQGRFGENNDGWVEIFPEFAEGLNGLESFSHKIIRSFKSRPGIIKPRVYLPSAVHVGPTASA